MAQESGWHVPSALAWQVTQSRSAEFNMTVLKSWKFSFEQRAKRGSSISKSEMMLDEVSQSAKILLLLQHRAKTDRFEVKRLE